MDHVLLKQLKFVDLGPQLLDFAPLDTLLCNLLAPGKLLRLSPEFYVLEVIGLVDFFVIDQSCVELDQQPLLHCGLDVGRLLVEQVNDHGFEDATDLGVYVLTVFLLELGATLVGHFDGLLQRDWFEFIEMLPQLFLVHRAQTAIQRVRADRFFDFADLGHVLGSRRLDGVDSCRRVVVLFENLLGHFPISTQKLK